VNRGDAMRRGAALAVSAGALGAVVSWAARQPTPRFPEHPRALLEATIFWIVSDALSLPLT
jgi:hypothetical protein